MTKDEKLGRIDIKATINKSKIVNIEIQLRNNNDIEKRSEFYGAKLITEQFGKKDKYEKLKPVILINILNYELLDLPEYYTKTVTVADKHREYEVIKDVTYYFIELPKFRKSKPKLANLLECWLAIIDGKGDLIEMAKEKDEIIKEAVEEVEEILSDAQIREINEYRQTAIWERNSMMHHAKEEGMRAGIEEGIKKGIREGKKVGIQEGRKEGRKEGKKEKQIEIAKKMKNEGMKLEDIQRITELDKEEIEKL